MKKHTLARRSASVAQLKRRAVLLLAITLLALMTAASNAWAQSLGSEWSPPINFSNVPDMFSHTPVLLCDAKQNTHLFWAERSDQQEYIYYSSDASGSWQEPIDILVAPRVDLFDAAITPDLQVHLIWATGNLGDLVYTSAPLAEASNHWKWRDTRILASDVSVMSDVYGGGNTLYADLTGVLHLVYGRPNDSIGISHSLYYIRSEDSGNSWSFPSLIITVVAPEPSNISGNIAVDEKGRLHVAWDVRSDKYASFSRLGYIRSVDSGKTWGHELELATGNSPFGAAMAAVFAFGDDEVHLTWGTPDRLHRWSNDGGETWSAAVPIMDLGAAYGGFNKLAKDSAGTLHVVAAVGNGVYHATWNGGGWNPAEALYIREIDPHGQQFVTCQGNRLHVAYYDRTGENEIWYSSKTTNAPELARTAITVSEGAPVPTPAPWEVTAPAARPTTSMATPPPSGSLETARASSSTIAGMLSPAIVGAASASLVVISVVVARLARRRR